MALSPPPLSEFNLQGFRHGLIAWLQELWRALDQTVYVFTASDTTPSVATGNVFITLNGVGTTITNFDDGSNGRTITVIVKDMNTTFSFIGLYLKGNGGVNWAAPYDSVLRATHYQGVWHCTCEPAT